MSSRKDRKEQEPAGATVTELRPRPPVIATLRAALASDPDLEGWGWQAIIPVQAAGVPALRSEVRRAARKLGLRYRSFFDEHGYHGNGQSRLIICDARDHADMPEHIRARSRRRIAAAIETALKNGDDHEQP
jgi:hypothetical protein